MENKVFLHFGGNKVSAELVSIKGEELQAENKTALSKTDVILSPFGKSDFSMKQHKVCTFKLPLFKIASFDLYLAFSCTVTFTLLVDAKLPLV